MTAGLVLPLVLGAVVGVAAPTSRRSPASPRPVPTSSPSWPPRATTRHAANVDAASPRSASGWPRDVHDTLAQARSRSLQPSQLAWYGRLRGAGPEPLTGREIEVLEHVAAGSSSRTVARALAIGEATVETHLLHIFRKLGVEVRTSAVTGAVQRGIIRLD